MFINSFKIKSIINGFLSKNGINKVFPIDLDRVACVLNTTIYYHSMPMSVSGILIPSQDDNVVIVNNRISSEGHKRFTIAHELSHIILHHPHKVLSVLLWSLEDNNFHFGYSPYEREANIAASELLMPTYKVKELFMSGLSDINSYCDYFNVSRSAMEIKLSTLGIILK